ncbi:MAG: ABC transporter substrate-binding protein, partial [Proteobacteria bacterium]|nr:ABC transporter substrate-binding protein [Pseudomonadota bacterium]
MPLIRPTRRAFLAGAGAVLAAPSAVRAQSEIREVRIAKQFGISYLPLMIMEDLQLVEKHAKAAGLGDIKTNWLQFAGGAPINDALISGNLEFAGGGVGPMIVLWARTKGSLNVKGVASLNSLPLYLNTVNAGVKT